jgi:hypothetical protein
LTNDACQFYFLFLTALNAGPVSQPGAAATLANKNALTLQSQMRPPPANLALGMMFYRYAAHDVKNAKVKTQNAEL